MFFFNKYVKIWKQAGICLDNSIVLNNRAIVLCIVISKYLSLNMLISIMLISIMLISIFRLRFLEITITFYK